MFNFFKKKNKEAQDIAQEENMEEGVKVVSKNEAFEHFQKEGVVGHIDGLGTYVATGVTVGPASKDLIAYHAAQTQVNQEYLTMLYEEFGHWLEVVNTNRGIQYDLMGVDEEGYAVFEPRGELTPQLEEAMRKPREIRLVVGMVASRFLKDIDPDFFLKPETREERIGRMNAYTDSFMPKLRLYYKGELITSEG